MLYLSRLIGCAVFDLREDVLGKIVDVYVRIPALMSNETEANRPVVIGFLLKINAKKCPVILNDMQIVKFDTQYKVQCQGITMALADEFKDAVLLKDSILDKQIVDITGRKLVRVNDVRMFLVASGLFVVAVDVGLNGLLRRIGINRPIQGLLSLFKGYVPSRFILWDDVEAVDLSSLSIQLSKTRSKLEKLHPSDLAEIIENLGKPSQTSLFSRLDEERAADVLEELDEKGQVHIIENMPVAKAADLLEKMPANEAATLLDYLEEEKTEELLLEMNPDTSDEVRKLLEYPESTVGSLMTTNILTFPENEKTDSVIRYIRSEKPDAETLYSIFVVDERNVFKGAVSLRGLLLAEPDDLLSAIMVTSIPCVNDYDKLDSLSDLVSKYNLLAIPVTNDENQLEGMVVVDDVIDDLLGKRRTT